MPQTAQAQESLLREERYNATQVWPVKAEPPRHRSFGYTENTCHCGNAKPVSAIECRDCERKRP